MKQLLLLLVISIFPLTVWGQSNQRLQIKGAICDKETQELLSSATVNCLRSTDSSKVALTFTDKSGYFHLDSLPHDNYTLYITYLGYQSLMYSIKKTTDNNAIELGIIAMQRTGFSLSQIEIIETKKNLIVKKDTLEFNAGYFKTRENAILEDLLKKIPGIQIDRDGTIRINGEIVKTVMVNGQPFFGESNPQIASKNLQAYLIDKVQLIDRKSSQRGDNNFNTEQSDKIINVTIKENKKNIVTGQITAAVGTKDRFSIKTSLSKFTDQQQLVFLGNGDNTNGSIDGGSASSGDMRRRWNTGINYSNELRKKITINAGYLMENNQTTTQLKSNRQNIMPDSISFYNQQSKTTDNSVSYMGNLQVKFKLDTLQTIIVSSQFGYFTTKSLLDNNYESLSEHLLLMNKGAINNTSTQKSNGISSSFRYIKNFLKAGRFLDIRYSYRNGQNNEIGYNTSNNLFNQMNGESFRDTINQQNTVNGASEQHFLMINYAEPLTKHISLQLTLGENITKTSSKKTVFEYNNLTNLYDAQIDSLENTYKNNNVQHYGKMGVYIQRGKIEYTMSLAAFANILNNYNYSVGSTTNLQTIVLMPTMNLNYAITNNKRIHFSYIKVPKFPQIVQLQTIADNTNPLYIRRGNSNLKAELSYNFDLSYKNFNPQTMNSFSTTITSRFIDNQIIDGTWLDSLGRQVITPINMNGAYNFQINIDNNFPVKTPQTIIGLNTVLNFNHDANYTNGINGNSTTLSLTQLMSYTFRYKQLLDFLASFSINYNKVEYSSQQHSTSDYYNYGLFFDGNINLPSNIIMGSNLNYKLGTGRPPGYNNDIVTINVYISKLLFTHKQGLIKIQGFDILNKNNNINRNIGQNYIEDQQTTALNRFFMIQLSYFLGKK
jgi:hypothetical protein